MPEPGLASTAVVSTDRPERYGKQLVSHLSRRVSGSWDEQACSGVVNFGDAQAELTCAEAALVMRLTAPADALDRLEDVLGRHLVRFGTRDELVVRWSRDDGSTGTEQRAE